MEVTMIETEKYNMLIEKIEHLEGVIVDSYKQYPFKERWLTNKEVCEYLGISSRTLQQYRDNRTLSYSKIQGKLYYKASDIESMLMSNLVSV